MEINKELFKSFSSDQKLDYIYEVLCDICDRVAQVEKNKWWNRTLASIAAGAAGAIAGLAAIVAGCNK